MCITPEVGCETGLLAETPFVNGLRLVYNNTRILCVCVYLFVPSEISGNGTSWRGAFYTDVKSFAWRVAQTASRGDSTHRLRDKGFGSFSDITR